jgi:hypothetical protein
MVITWLFLFSSGIEKEKEAKADETQTEGDDGSKRGKSETKPDANHTYLSTGTAGSIINRRRSWAQGVQIRLKFNKMASSSGLPPLNLLLIHLSLPPRWGSLRIVFFIMQ